MRSILVTGGTGRLGSEVVTQLLDRGHTVRIASRRPCPADPRTEWATVDYRANTGVTEAVDGADAIVHTAGSMRVPVDQRLIDAIRHTGGAPHLVYISIVGVDRVPMFYYRSKLAAERQFASTGLPLTILRATQFHDLVRLLLAGLTRLPVLAVPRIPVQPIDVADVATRLADLATGPPQGRADDIGGPEVAPFPDLARQYLAAARLRRPITAISMPGKVFRAYRDGGHLARERVLPGATFADYLATRSDLTGLGYRPATR